MSLPQYPFDSEIPIAESIYVRCVACGGVGQIGTRLSPGVACRVCDGTGTVRRYKPEHDRGAPEPPEVSR